MKRISAVVIIVVFMAGTLFAAGQKPAAATTSEPTVRDEPFELGSERLEFSLWQAYDWASGQDWPMDDRLGDIWIRDELDVHIEAPGADGAARQKLNFMIIEDSFFDVLQLDRGPDVTRLVQNGKLIAVDEWLDTYTNLRDGLGEDLLNLLRSDDGKLYQIPNWAIGPDRLNGNTGWFVESRIYEELGSPSLATFDDMYRYLERVKARYPNVVPLETGDGNQAFAWVVSGFGNYLDGGFVTRWYASPVDGELRLILDNDAFVEGALWYSRAFRNGLITQDAFTQTRDQVREKLNTRRVAVMVSNDAAGEADISRSIIRQSEPGAEPWKFIDPVLSANNPTDLSDFRWMARDRLGWNVNVITKDAADRAEKIFAFFDWMFGPYGAMVMRLGPPDVMWDATNWDPDAEMYPQLTDRFFAATADEHRPYRGTPFVGNTSFADGFGEALNAQIDDPAMRNWKQTQFTDKIWKYAYDGTEFANLLPPPDTDEGIVYQEVRDIMDETYARIAFAASDAQVREVIADARRAVIAAGFEDVLAHYNEVWTSNRRAMGLD